MPRLVTIIACLAHTRVKGETGWVVVTEQFIDRMSQSPTVGVIFAPCERCTAAQQSVDAGAGWDDYEGNTQRRSGVPPLRKATGVG